MKTITIEGKEYELRKDNVTKKMIQGLRFKDFMSVLMICSTDEDLLRWFFSQISEDQKDMLVAMGVLEKLG